MSSQDAAEAAARVTEAFLRTAASQGDENAQRMLQDAQPEPAAATPPPVSSTPTAAAETAPEPQQQEEPEPEVELPDFTPNLTDDLAALLDEPDFEEEAAAEVTAEYDELGGDPEYDPAEQKRLRALEKRNEWLERQVVQANRGKWIAENERAYPILATYAKDELRAIDATSRRAFAREAAALNERLTKILKPALDDIAKAKAALKDEATVEARQAVEQAWGKPIANTGASGPDPIASELEAARQRRAPLAERIKILMKAGG